MRLINFRDSSKWAEVVFEGILKMYEKSNKINITDEERQK